MESDKKTNYNELDFEAFKNRALDSSLSKYEKIGFPDTYREGKESLIFDDLNNKLDLKRENISILDIGCGCSDLVHLLIENATKCSQQLILNDCEEMLKLVENNSNAVKIVGKFPDNFDSLEKHKGSLDVIITYSVLHIVTLKDNPFNFIDKALELLNSGGALFLGDIQNISKRNRFFQSEAGQIQHKEFMGSDTQIPPPQTGFPESYTRIDDAILLSIMARYRGLGFETYLLPQNKDLPFGNRREDLLIVRN